MPKKTTAKFLEPISVFTFEELLQEMAFDLRIKEFVVMEIEMVNHAVELNKPFRSDYFAIIILQEGNIGFRLDDRSFDAEKGDIIFSPMAETICIEKISSDYKAKYIFFSLDFISEAGFNYKSNNVIKSLSEDPTHIIRRQPDIYRKINFHLDELKSLNDTEKENYYANEMIWHHFSLVIYEIDNYYKKTEKISTVSYREDEITTSFFTLVRKHFKEQHNVQFYADQLFISRKYLTKVINKTVYKSPREIIHQVLAVEARLLLRNSNSNVGEVAAQLHFSDQATFSKFFKKHTGKSPLDYKKDDLY